MGPINKKLCVYCFGSFDITYDGKSILPHQISGKVAELLKYCLFHKNTELKVSDILRDLFPDGKSESAMRDLNGCYTKIISFLAFDNKAKMGFEHIISIVQKDDCFVVKVTDEAEIDLDAFTQLCRQIENEKIPNAMREDITRLIEYYDDGVVPEFENVKWQDAFGKIYQEDFENAIRIILARLKELDKYWDILDICERTSKYLDLDEQFNIIYMETLQKVGQVNNALKRYEYIEERLSADANEAPSRKLKNIYKTLCNTKSIQSGHELSSEVSENMIRKIVEEMFNDYFMSRIAKYSIAQIIVQCEEGSDAREIEDIRLNLASALKYVLRKNDMYVMFGDNMAIAVLCDAREEYFSNICNRIRNTFIDTSSKEVQYSLKIEIKPVVNII